MLILVPVFLALTTGLGLIISEWHNGGDRWRGGGAGGYAAGRAEYRRPISRRRANRDLRKLARQREKILKKYK